MRVTVEADTCVAAGQCALAAPAVFDQREKDGIVVLLQEQPPADQHEAVREAAMLCPSMAVQVAE